jgi:hypothetical protein
VAVELVEMHQMEVVFLRVIMAVEVVVRMAGTGHLAPVETAIREWSMFGILVRSEELVVQYLRLVAARCTRLLLLEHLHLKAMAIFAKVSEPGVVLDVVVVSEQHADNGQDYLASVGISGNWVETWHNGAKRKNYAGIGFTYDSERDAFIPPKPHEYMMLNEATCLWEYPVKMPDDGNLYFWDDAIRNWQAFYIDKTTGTRKCFNPDANP